MLSFCIILSTFSMLLHAQMQIKCVVGGRAGVCDGMCVGSLPLMSSDCVNAACCVDIACEARGMGNGFCRHSTDCTATGMKSVLAATSGCEGLPDSVGCCVASMESTIIVTVSPTDAEHQISGTTTGIIVGASLAGLLVVAVCAYLAWKATDLFFEDCLGFGKETDYGLPPKPDVVVTGEEDKAPVVARTKRTKKRRHSTKK